MIMFILKRLVHNTKTVIAPDNEHERCFHPFYLKKSDTLCSITSFFAHFKL